jgi:hypothetical protein
MHLLEALAFVAEIKHAVAIGVGTAVGVLLHQRVQSLGGFIADLDHHRPCGGNLPQVRFLACGQDCKFVDGKQFGFELASFGVERRMEFARDGGDATIKSGEHFIPQILQVRLSEACVHGRETIGTGEPCKPGLLLWRVWWS